MAKEYERILTDNNGKDTGVRENYTGAMYIDKKVFLASKKVKETISKIAAAKRAKII